jgi:hypothetical protein
MTLRASDLFRKNDVELNVLQEYFLTIGMAKVATSAYEAFDLGILQKGKDIVVVNKDRQIATAKQVAMQMAEQGYTLIYPDDERFNDFIQTINGICKVSKGTFLVRTRVRRALVKACG